MKNIRLAVANEEITLWTDGRNYFHSKEEGIRYHNEREMLLNELFELENKQNHNKYMLNQPHSSINAKPYQISLLINKKRITEINLKLSKLSK